MTRRVAAGSAHFMRRDHDLACTGVTARYQVVSRVHRRFAAHTLLLSSGNMNHSIQTIDPAHLSTVAGGIGRPPVLAAKPFEMPKPRELPRLGKIPASQYFDIDGKGGPGVNDRPGYHFGQ